MASQRHAYLGQPPLNGVGGSTVGAHLWRRSGGTGATSAHEIIARLRSDADYLALFRRAFPDEADVLTDEQRAWDAIVKALSTFVRGMISADSPFDRFVYQGTNRP